MNLVPKPNVLSLIWAHFGFEPDDKGQKANLDEATCHIRRKKVSASQGNLSKLRSHVLINHPAAFAWLGSSTPASGGSTASGQQRQLGVSEAFARGAKHQCDSNQW